jgi:hypothetical protein
MADDKKKPAGTEPVKTTEVTETEAPVAENMPPVVNLEQMKKDYPERGESAFYEIGIAGGFGDFSHGKHPGAQFELATLTGTHREAVQKIFAGLNK